jgi:uncharacterized protein YfiM (DUF2279 family)
MHMHHSDELVLVIHQAYAILAAACEWIKDFAVAELKATHFLRLSSWKYAKADISVGMHKKTLSLDSALFPVAECNLVVLGEKHPIAVR